MTPAGIERATFRFVAQHLNHCATADPQFYLERIMFQARAVEKSKYAFYVERIFFPENRAVYEIIHSFISIQP